MARKATSRGPRGRLSVDQAIIALLVGAMNANQHVAAEEAERARHIIWSMRRFRRRSGDTVARLVDGVRRRIERDGTAAVVRQAARAIPARLRPSAFAVAVDLVLVDGALQREERQYLTGLAAELRVPARLAREIVSVIGIKNGA